jgi:hypothetical protein
MKTNNVILWAFVALFVAACSKAPNLEPGEESIEGKTLLSFTIDGFAQENVPFPKSPNLQSSLKPLSGDGSGSAPFNIRDYANVIKYQIFKYTELVDSVTQYASDPDFGTYRKYVPASKDSSQREQYFIGISAAMLKDGQSMKMEGFPGSLTVSFPSSQPDAFYAYERPYILEGQPFTSVKLKRIVGKVEVIPTDSIPENAGRVEIEITDIAKHFEMVRARGFFETPTTGADPKGSQTDVFPIKPEDIGAQDTTFGSYFMLKSVLGTVAPPRTVAITTYDKNNQVIIKRVVPNVNLQLNQITRLRGPVFSNHPNADFSIELESDWKSEIHEIEF